MSSKTIEVKKLFNKFASVRDYVVRDCVASGSDLVILHNGKSIRISIGMLRNPLQLVKKTFESKFGGQPYSLYDFKFIPN